MNRIAQIGALALLEDREFIQGVVVQVSEGQQEYEALGAVLNLPTVPSATNFVVFD